MKFLPVYILTVVNGLSMTMLFPLLPVIISQYSQPAIMLGVLTASYSFFQMIGAPILGAMSDKYGRKPILILTQIGTFLSWCVLGLAFFMPESTLILGMMLPIFVLLVARVIDGITGGNSSVAQAMVADVTTKKERSIVYGKNGAIMGGVLIIGPALGSLPLSFGYGLAGTAFLGGIISAIACAYLIYGLKETLLEKKSELTISFQDLNIVSQIMKWKSIPVLKMAMTLKIFFFVAFVSYTTISGLYLIDVFSFQEENIGYYLMFTGLFLIFHQAVSVKKILSKVTDINGFLIGQVIMGTGFFAMALSHDIYLFTAVYSIAVLGVVLSMNTIQAIFSTSVDEKSQGEIMGLYNGIESILMIIAPLLSTFLYGFLGFSIYFFIAAASFVSLGVYFFWFRSME